MRVTLSEAFVELCLRTLLHAPLSHPPTPCRLLGLQAHDLLHTHYVAGGPEGPGGAE